MRTTCTLDTFPKCCLPLLTKVRGRMSTQTCWRYLKLGFYCGSPLLHQGQTAKVKPFPLMGLLPRHNMSQYYRYYGSLTTPPCSQAVVWTLYQVPIYISWSQVCLQIKKKKVFFFLSAESDLSCLPSSSQLAQFTSQIFATEEDAEQVTPLQNNFRHIHPTFGRSVTASRDAILPKGAAGRPIRAAVLLLPITFLGSFGL